MTTSTRKVKKQNSVVIEDFDGGQRKVTVNGSMVVFNDDSDNFNMWTMIDVLNALGVKWDFRQLADEEVG